MDVVLYGEFVEWRTLDVIETDGVERDVDSADCTRDTPDVVVHC